MNKETSACKQSKIQAISVAEDWFTTEPPKPEFIIDPLIPKGVVTLLVATGGIGKTFLALKMCLHICLGLDIAGATVTQSNVGFVSLEDSQEHIKYRLHHIAKESGEDILNQLPELSKRFFYFDRYGEDTFVVENSEGNFVVSKIVDELIDEIKRNDIKCLFIDTLVRSHSLNENDNGQMSSLLKAYEKITKETKCSIVLLHHIPKNGSSKTHAARGASAITDNARSAMKLEEHTCKKFKDGKLIKLIHTKHNHSSQHPDQYFLISDKGVPTEVDIEVTAIEVLEERYIEMYNWFVEVWKEKPLTRTNIRQHYQKMRPEGTTHNKEKYIEALEVAIEEGYAVPIEHKTGNNTNSKFFILKPLD